MSDPEEAASGPDAGDGLAVLSSVVARQTADLTLYAGFLLETLAAVVPPDRIDVVRQRGRFGRSAPDAPVLSVRVTLGERSYGLARTSVDATPTATVAHIVGGIVLRTETVDLGRWSEALAADLRAAAAGNADAAATLARLTGFTV